MHHALNQAVYYIIHTCVDPAVCLHSLHRLAVEQQCSAVTPGWRVATLCTVPWPSPGQHTNTLQLRAGLCSGSVILLLLLIWTVSTAAEVP